jgi:hypothetical protein
MSLVLIQSRYYVFFVALQLLSRLSASSQVKNNNVKIQTDDLQTFDALERDVKKVEVAMKLFLKWGKAKAVQELLEDNNA